MKIDRHFPRWGVADKDVERTRGGGVDLFIDGSPNLQPSAGHGRDAPCKVVRRKFASSEGLRTWSDCLNVTFELHFYDASQTPACGVRLLVLPAKARGRAGFQRPTDGARAPNQVLRTQFLRAGVVATGLPRPVYRLSAVAAPHLAALALMFETENRFRLAPGLPAVLGILNFFLDHVAGGVPACRGRCRSLWSWCWCCCRGLSTTSRR